MYSYELKTAIISALKDIPEVESINYLQYWGEHIFFIVLQPKTPEAMSKAEATLQALIGGIGGASPPRVRLRFFQAGELLPSSASLFRRKAIAPLYK